MVRGKRMIFSLSASRQRTWVPQRQSNRNDNENVSTGLTQRINGEVLKNQWKALNKEENKLV